MWDAIKNAAFWFVDVYRLLWALAAFCVAAWLFWIHPRLVAAHQVHNWAIIQSYVSFLETYRQEHGVYPKALAEAVPATADQRDVWLAAFDGYGHPLHFSSNGDEFSIVSYGKDGAPDRDAMGLGDPEIATADWVCGDENIDTKYSSNGNRQLCGK
jgi:hypothetical protein